MRGVQSHLDRPHDTVVPAGAVDGCAGGSCGDLVRFFLDVREGLIARCAVRARGNRAAVAAASAFAEAAEGLTVMQAARMHLGSLHPEFAQLKGREADAGRVVEDALHHALGAYVRGRMRVDGAAADPGGHLDAGPVRALVAMSGGVDSAVALHRMYEQEKGRVAGVTLRLWIDPSAPDPEAACCSPDSVRRARATCHALGVPHVSLDLRGAFARSVVQPFVADYREGLTPNPCVRCNGSFRLDELVRCADVLGARTVATGHYVRTVRRGGLTLVQRGVDRRKDQSYMLATLDPGTLERFAFPLGAWTKDESRARAAELELVQATAPESQEICFLGGGDYRRFLERAGAMGPVGEIRDPSGTVLGTHDGIARFTPGQRRGLSVQAPPGTQGPLYVSETDPSSGTVVVASREHLYRHEVRLSDTALHQPTGGRLLAQLRYRSTAVAASVRRDAAGAGATLAFEEPVLAPAPGQLAALYDDEGVVVGSGRIARTPG